MKIYYYTTATIKTQKYLLNSIFSALAMATSLHPSNAFYHRFTPTSYKHRILNFYRRFPSSFSGRFRVLTYRGSGHGVCSSSSISKASNANNTEAEKVAVQQEKENYNERPPFDINLAVVLAGFAYEAYTSSPKNVGKWEADAAGCKTVCLSKLREIYDGQLFIKLKKGFDFPALDPWVAAWDANLVTPHKRMGNTGIGLKCLCDGNLYEVLINLEGMGGGGKLQLEIKGEKELIEKILLTEIYLFSSMRDGRGILHHMEDFYYITLLETVRSNYQTFGRVESSERDSFSTS